MRVKRPVLPGFIQNYEVSVGNDSRTEKSMFLFLTSLPKTPSKTTLQSDNRSASLSVSLAAYKSDSNMPFLVSGRVNSLLSGLQASYNEDYIWYCTQHFWSSIKTTQYSCPSLVGLGSNEVWRPNCSVYFPNAISNIILKSQFLEMIRKKRVWHTL